MSKIQSYFNNLANRVFPIGQIVQNLPYAMIFKTTHWCPNKCPHCCESAGAHMPKTFIPADVVEQYIKQAKTDPKFSRELVFTGGEVMSAYQHHDTQYVPQLLNMALDNGCQVDIKTNAGWAIAKNTMREQIFNDLVGVLSAHSTSAFRMTPMQISLSLDRFHPHAMQKNVAFITEMAQRQHNSSCLIHITSFEKDADMFAELLNNLTTKYDVYQLVAFGGENNGNICQTMPDTLWSVNGNIVLKFSIGTLFDGGRAKDIDGAYHTPEPRFAFISGRQNPMLLMAFDTFGNVTLGENSGKKITVPWRDNDGTPRPLSEIRRDLVKQTRKTEVQYTAETFVAVNKAVFKSIKQDINTALGRIGIKKR